MNSAHCIQYVYSFKCILTTMVKEKEALILEWRSRNGRDRTERWGNLYIYLFVYETGPFCVILALLELDM